MNEEERKGMKLHMNAWVKKGKPEMYTYTYSLPQLGNAYKYDESNENK